MNEAAIYCESPSKNTKAKGAGHASGLRLVVWFMLSCGLHRGKANDLLSGELQILLASSGWAPCRFYC